MEYLLKLEKVLNNGHEQLLKWPLVQGYYMPFLLCFCYFVMTQVGPFLMMNRKPYDLRKVMIVFNFFIVFMYASSLLLALYYLPKVSWKILCTGEGGMGEPFHQLLKVVWVVYALKYVEFLDTLFFILRKKDAQVTFLHVVHHSILPIIFWVEMRTEKSALQSIPLILNCIVHVIMYSYYGLAAMGPTVRKYLWWKKYLTQLQIVQFVLIILFVTVIAPLSGCPMFLTSYLVDLIFAPFFLILFFKFYQASFKPDPILRKVE